MRKSVYLLFLILLLSAMSLPVLADTPEQLWPYGSYPDDVSYVYFNGESWEIGLVDADDDRKQELTNLFSDCTVSFTDCVITFTQRTEILNEILSAGDENILNGMLVQDSEEIFLVVKNSQASKYAALFQREYGSVVIVAKESGEIPGAAASPTISFKTLLVIGAVVAFVIIFSTRYAKLKKGRLEL